MKRILFVDDEPNVLSGLQNLLRKQRGEWSMAFAVGGQEALAELAKAPYDVIVSDMRMPGMDGAALLHRVKTDYPGVARIVLSGYAERDAVMRALPVAHQYLSKPCDGEVLREVIERVCRMQAMLAEERLRQVIGRMDRLPSAPKTYWELERVLANPDAGIADVAIVVERDPSMAIKLLQLSNSAFFGLGRQVTSVAQAVSYLGIELVKGLALTTEVFGELEKNRPVDGFLLDELQRDAFITAKVVKKILAGDPRQAEFAFTAAVVHDIGQLVVATSMREQFAGIVQVSLAGEQRIHEAELDVLGVSHPEIGAYLLGIWGLPPTIVEAVACHHNPSMVPSELNATSALHVAVELVDAELGKARTGPDGVDPGLMVRSAWAGHLASWREIARREVLTAGGASPQEH
jgi:HD-like signal output (HDOD) protein